MNAKRVVLALSLVVGWASSCKKGGDNEGEKKEKGGLDTDTYRKKSMTTEAHQFLKKMSNAARTYYSTPMFTGSADSLAGAISEKQFPKSSAITPPLGSCCKDGGKCNPASGQWDNDTWVALDFAMVDPHYYSYQFITRKDDDGTLSYTAMAYGDLDCDGMYSTYSFYGQVVEGEVQAAGDILKTNPLE